MRRRANCLLFVSVALLAACEGGGDPVEQALREAATARQAAATSSTAELEARRPAATGDQTWVAAAIGDHRRAITRAETALRDTGDPEIRRLARSAIDSHQREIAALRAWRAPAAQPPGR